MSVYHPELAELARREGRYAYEAYTFLFHALDHARHMLGIVDDPSVPVAQREQRHITGGQLVEGVRSLAIQEFGMMAATVFRLWGVRTTEDIGLIVFSLVDAGLMSKTPEDSMEDFRGLFDLEQELAKGCEIQLDDGD